MTTYDGTTLSVYADGVLMNQTTPGLAGTTIFSPAAGYPINIGSARTSSGSTAGEQGSILTGVSSTTPHARFHIAKVRIMDGVLTPADIANNYSVDKGAYQALTPGTLSHLPIHRWVFSNSPGDAANAMVADTGAWGNANATVYSIPGSGMAGFTGTSLYLAGGSPTNGGFVDLGTSLISSLSAVATNNGLTPGTPGYASSAGTGTGQVTVEGWLTVKGHPGSWQTYFAFGDTTATNVYTVSTNDVTNYVTTNVVDGRIIGLAMFGQSGPGGPGPGNAQTGGNTSGYAGANTWLLQQNDGDPTLTSMLLLGSTNSFYGGYNTTPAVGDYFYGYGDNQHYPYTMTHYASSWNEATHEIITYINGEMVQRQITDKMMYMIHDRNCWLGRDLFFGNPTLEGDYSEFRMYSNVLSPAEILGDYELGPGLNTTALAAGALTNINLVRTTSSANVAGSVAYFQITADYSSPANATGVVVTPNAVAYASDNTNAVQVLPGMLKFVNPGSANVTATYQGANVTVPVTVTAPNATLARRYEFWNSSHDGIAPYDEVTASYAPGDYGYNDTMETGNAGVLITNGAGNGYRVGLTWDRT